MSRVKVTTMVGERLVTVEVDRATLAQTMHISNEFAKRLGKRPGEPGTILNSSNGRPTEEISTFDKTAVRTAIEIDALRRK
jgi:hypothetical protein